MPVFYMGVTSDEGGHAFVCDGYRDGYFHINWGWSGVSNGYFLLWSLDPDVQGTGGSSSGNGFDFYQDILTARPAEAGDVAVPQVLCDGSFGVDTTSVAIGDTVVFTGGFWNYSASKFHLTLGIKLVDGNGKATYVESFVSDSFDMYYGYPYFSMEASAFPAGDKVYAVYPACRDEANGRWYDIKVQPATGRGYLIAEVSGQGIEFSVPGPESSKLEAGSPELLTKAYAGSQFKVKSAVDKQRRGIFRRRAGSRA